MDYIKKIHLIISCIILNVEFFIKVFKNSYCKSINYYYINHRNWK